MCTRSAIRGVALCTRRAFLEEALTSYAKVLALEPSCAEAHYNRGIALTALKDAKDGRASSDADSVRQNMKLLEDALASFDAALALRADFPEAREKRARCKAALVPSHEVSPRF